MKFSNNISKTIASLIKEGNFDSVAYGSVGISKQTYYRWLKEKRDFRNLIKKAKNDRIASLISQIRDNSSWQSKAWMLERLMPGKFHLPLRVEKEMFERIEKLEKSLEVKEYAKN